MSRGVLIRAGAVLVTLALIAGGIFVAYMVTPQNLPGPTPIVIATLAPTPTDILPTHTSTPAPAPTPTVPKSTPTPGIPVGGIVYVLEPDINSVGWVQSDQPGNFFGESYLYSGLRGGELHYGAIQFDLSFIADGSTIFLAELQLTGLDDQGLTTDDRFLVSLLADEIDESWSRHGFEEISQADVEENILPELKADQLRKAQNNILTFNASQRSIVEERLESNLISFRLDNQSTEGWFAWDTGYGSETTGAKPILRLGVLPPVATEAAAIPPDSTPTPTPTFIIVTSTPLPENVLTAAAVAPTLTLEATTTGTPTPVPGNWVTPWLITSTPTPENEATASYIVLEGTAVAVAFGTPTSLPVNMATATATATGTPTPVLILLDGDLPPQTPTPTPSLTPMPTPTIPPQLIGKIAFISDRTGVPEYYVINPDGTGLALLTNPWPYNVARLADQFSADGRYRVFTKDATRYKEVGTGSNSTGVREDVPAVFWRDALYNVEEQLTFFGKGIAWNGVWSPMSEKISFVSNDSGDDEIWVVNRDGSDILRLTTTNEAYNAREIGKDTFFAELNGHPSWSPDGSRIVFWSNRNGNSQIWIMNADGSEPYTLSKPAYRDWAPVWIKYPGVPGDGIQKHLAYGGPYDPFGADRNCVDFEKASEAQLFFYAAGGPASDPHELDPDIDGTACN
jgi:hypothetical protein